MNHNPLFSILLANYNNAPFLEKCLASIYAQTHKNWEVIFVDDCSTDDSAHIIQGHADKDPNIKVFFNESNQGCGFTKARCIQLASGGLCGFLDTDDALMPDALETMAQKHLEFPGAALIYSRRFICDKKLKITDISDDDTGKFISQLATPLINHFAVFKKALYDKTAGIDTGMKRAVDQDLYLKLEEKGDIVFIPRPLYLYRHNSNSISLNRNEYKAQAWHIYANTFACKRRNLSLDNYCDIIKPGKNKTVLLAVHSFLHYVKNIGGRRKRLRAVFKQSGRGTGR